MSFQDLIQDKTMDIKQLKTKCLKENRGPTPSDMKKLDALLAEIENLSKADKAERRVFGEERTSPPEAYIGACGLPSRDAEVGPLNLRGKTYREMFPGRKEDAGIWKPGEFFDVLESGRHDPRLKRAMGEGLGSAGGFAVPSEMSSKWLDAALTKEVVRPLCIVYPMNSSSLKIPGWDSMDMSSGDMASFTMEYVGENTAATAQTGKLRLIELNAQKGMIYAEASNELVADGLGFEAQLEQILIKSIAYGIDKGCLVGTGAGQPLGVLNSVNSRVVVTKETAQIADSICYENLAKMWSRMYPAGRSNAVWVGNSNIIPQLLQITITGGVGATHYPVINETSGNYFIFGRPVYFSPVMPTLGDQGDLALVDFSQYALGIRADIGISKSIHPGFQSDKSSYRVIVRYDAMGTWNTYFTPEVGDTMSWAVLLGERA